MRLFYSLLLYLLLPWALLRLWWRGFADQGYRQHCAERLGYVRSSTAAPVIWLHAVSVGEVRAAAPLIRALQQRWPQQLWITTTTPTGRATLQQLFGEAVRYSYLPYDLPGSVRRFLTRVSPQLAIMLETEIWPNLYAALRRRAVPLVLVNARLSSASVRAYARFPGLTSTTLQCVTRIVAQSEADAARFRQLGATQQQLGVAGNLKFDATLPEDFVTRGAALRERFGATRPLWVAASTHPGEEQLVLDAHRKILAKVPAALLLLVPRHPERCAGLKRLCCASRLASRLYSSVQAAERNDRVILVDVLGELFYLYAVASVAFIGGSLVAAGGHNPIEALLAEAPVVSGPQRDNFAEIYQLLEEQGAVSTVDSSAALAAAVAGLLADPTQRQAAVAAGRRVIEQQSGALQRTLEIIEPLLPHP